MSKKITVILTVIIIVLGGVGAPLALRFWDPPWSPFRPEPEEVIRETVLNLSESKAFRANVGLKSSIPNEGGINFDGDFKIREEPENFLGTLVDFQIRLEIPETELILGGEWKDIGDDAFLKLTTLPDLSLLELYFREMGINLSEKKNQWLELDSNFFGVKPEKLGEELKHLVAQEDFYLIDKEMRDETIGKNEFYHYSVNFNNSKIKDLIIRVWPALDAAVKEGELGRGEVWIGKDDLSFYRLRGKTGIVFNRVGEMGGGAVGVDFEVFPLP